MSGVWQRILGGLRTTFVGGLSLFRLAPVIPLIAIVPEFAQHVAEIRLGMFESPEAFAAMGNDPQRWFWAYFKIAGFVVAILAATRFIGGAGKNWWRIGSIAWGPFLAALALNIAYTAVGVIAHRLVPGGLPMALDAIYQVLGLPLMIYLVGPLIGDRTMTLKRAYTKGWLAVAMAAVLSLLAFGPAQLLHQYNHTLAMGQSEMVVWALMVWDSLLVGIIACWFGAALAAGYWLGLPPGNGVSANDAPSGNLPEPA